MRLIYLALGHYFASRLGKKTMITVSTDEGLNVTTAVRKRKAVVLQQTTLV
jgi:hypothetical protein